MKTISHPKPWEVLNTEPGPDLIIFKARFDQVRNPRNGYTMKAVVLEAPEWVNVVALTPEGKALVVEQHRFGIGHPTIEIPAGLVEPGEAPQQAARRELEEETGYTTSSWESLGIVEANPAFLNNHCHFWLARDVTRTRETHLDRGEDVVVAELTLEQLQDEIERGNIRNSLCLLALSRVFDLRKVKL
jgi:8-oxo-dGTP pyrophosphatase MutT (NUDIX family)